MSYRNPKIIDDKSGLIVPQAIEKATATLGKGIVAYGLEEKKRAAEQKKIDDEIKEKRKPKPEIAGDSLTDKVTRAIKGVDIKVIVGVSFGVFVVLFLCVVCIVKRCRKRPKSYRRWETLDYGKKFYTNLKHDDKDMDDFEVDVTDGTTKLIDSSKD